MKKNPINYEHIQNESRKFYCTFILINILAFKVKKNEITITSFDYFTDIFLSIHVELITYHIHNSNELQIYCSTHAKYCRLD